ncbi:zinc ribbon domain-containing protein [Clostridium lundense]|uniref:zinc ribbon domain-containing protein n=1 Tax=Clostridium lundense TaxID=319475 RepID=UPI00047F160E|nr:zinc ribbon domain-containing protein [Clostridium lundense]
MERMYCQSCGMPLTDEKELGTNKDGSKNNEYCIYCFEQGAFKDDMTMEQMIDFCVPHMVKANPNMNEKEAKENLQRFFPTLKRWRTK